MRFASTAISLMAMPMARLTGLVLSGGASRRMGRDKAQLVIKGKTLSEIMVGKLCDAGCDPVLISGQCGIKDIYPGQGPMAGIHAAFAHFGNAKAMIVVPVDMPNLRVQSLLRLAKTDGEAVWYQGQSLPIKLENKKHIHALLEKILEENEGDWSIRNFVKNLNGTALLMDEAAVTEWSNLNTPEEFKKMEQTHET